jgi:hypothetical protein
MQIGQLNHLKYPSLGNQPGLGNAADDADAATGATSTPQDAPGIIVKLQSDSSTPPGLALGRDLVYSNGRPGNTDNDSDADTRRMAEQHRMAMGRAASTPASLAIDKDGVLVAKPAASGSAAPQDFVSFAVNTMRDFADEQARLKAQNASTEGASGTSLIPRSLGDVQKLAARFKLFA